MDSDTEIDPDLFLKCRLCINNAGLYQIHQSLQKQIKFCFDITIKHDDCLSQLLCKSCKKNVADYNAAKIQYLDNQTVLSQKLNEKRLAKAETKNNNDTTISCSKEDSSTESDKNNVKDALSNISTMSDRSNEREIENNSIIANRSSRSSDHDEIRVDTKKPKKIKSLFLSSRSGCSVEDEFNIKSQVSDTACSTENSQKTHKIEQKKSLPWKKYYKKRIYCRICNLFFSKKEHLNSHVKTHSKLLKIKKRLIKNHCKIEMEKVDDKHNLTGTYKAVVMSSDNIVMMEGDENYFVTYVPKSDHVFLKDERKRSLSAARNIDLDDSSDDDFKQKHRKKKMVRLRSSSNETVVIDANTNNGSESNNSKRFSVVSDDSSDVQCVNIDDSSNDSGKQTSQPMERDLQIVHDIISGCYDKYLCNYNNEAYNDRGNKGLDLKLLNKKLFSTGRKNMTSTGVETPGLLKYLEHKNLAINWIGQAKQTNTNKSVVRIIPKVALPDQPNAETPSLLGWMPVKENIELIEIEVPAISHSSSLVCNPMEEKVESVIHKIALPKTTSQDHEMANVTKLKHQKSQDAPLLQLILESKKLLNANPVANPKQLPKKNAAHETKNSVISAEFAPNTVMGNNNSESRFTISDDETESNAEYHDLHSMPIITSTTSLAPQHNTGNKQHNTAAQNNVEDSLKNNTDKPVLRCKPVSQLMPQSNSLDPPNTSIQENAVANISSNVRNAGTLLTIPPTPSNRPINSSVIMNSVDLPNTSNLTPIEYFKTLLEMRNMILISEKNYKLSKDFIILVKFKLELTQSGKSLILGLALFSNPQGRIFCIKIGNVNEEMDIDFLAPHWQVRILKSFGGQVSEKILECAKTAKQINRDLHDNVRQFVLLLKNIEFI